MIGRYLFLSCVVITCSGIKSAMQDCPPPAQNQRDLVIINDPSFNELLFANRAMSINVFQYLCAELCPILAQITVWQRFVRELETGSLLLLEDFVQNLPFDFYLVHDVFVLIIPHAYKKRWNIDNDNELGFNFNDPAIKKIEKPFELQPFNKISYQIEKIKKSLKISLFSGIGESLTSIPDIVSVLKHMLPQGSIYNWNIILHGHGLNDCNVNIIAGLERSIFQYLLNFFKNDVKTNLLCYSSCFGGSKPSLIDAYLLGEKQLTFNFPIIVNGIGNVETYTITREPIVFLSAGLKKEFESTAERWKNFFEGLRNLSLCEKNSREIIELCDDLFNFRSIILFQREDQLFKKFSISTINNLLQIRWPHKSFFKAISLKDLIALSSTITPTKSVIQPSAIPEDVFLIDTPYLNESLDLQSNKSKIVSVIPGQVFHYIRALRSLNRDLFELFSPLSKLSGFERFFLKNEPKVFLIDSFIFFNPDQAKYETYKNVMISINNPSLWGLKITPLEIFVTKQGKAYNIQKSYDKYEEKPLTEIQTKEYNKFYISEKEKLKQQYESLLSLVSVHGEPLPVPQKVPAYEGSELQLKKFKRELEYLLSKLQ